MDRDQALEVLRAHRDELSRRGVRHAALFGSTARGQAQPGSDLDIMVDLDPAAELDVFGYVVLIDFIRDLFVRMRVDVSNHEALKPHVRATAERDAIYAF
jgi:predicted nucleotidyltransferase